MRTKCKTCKTERPWHADDCAVMTTAPKGFRGYLTWAFAFVFLTKHAIELRKEAGEMHTPIDQLSPELQAELKRFEAQATTLAELIKK